MKDRAYSSVSARVKELVLLLVLAMWYANFAETMGANLALGWDPSPDAQVTGYKVYYGVAGSAKKNVNVGKTTQASLSDLEPGKNYEIYVTAYDGSGVESDPSNAVLFWTSIEPFTTDTNLYQLAFTGFKDGSVQFWPRGSGPAGDQYALGTQVTLTAGAKKGATFLGWIVNGMQYPAGPATITVSGNTTVTPLFKSDSGTIASGDATGGLSMSIRRSGTSTYLNIGGEVGAWVLEATNDLANWVEIKAGLTSETVSVGSGTANSFFRVRSRY